MPHSFSFFQNYVWNVETFYTVSLYLIDIKMVRNKTRKENKVIITFGKGTSISHKSIRHFCYVSLLSLDLFHVFEVLIYMTFLLTQIGQSMIRKKIKISKVFVIIKKKKNKRCENMSHVFFNILSFSSRKITP